MLLFDRLDAINKIYRVDDTDLTLADKFIDSIIGDYKEPHVKPKCKKQTKSKKEIKLKSYQQKPYLTNYYGKSHIYRHIENILHDGDDKRLTAREMTIRLKTIRKVSLFDSKRYSLYLLASDTEYFKIYTCGYSQAILPFPRRFTGRTVFSIRTLFSYGAYLSMMEMDVTLQKKYLMFLNERRVG